MKASILHLIVLIAAVSFSGLHAQPAPAPAATTAPAASTPLPPGLIKELVGTWTNTLGSTFTIASIDSITGRLDGSYQSPQGTASSTAVGWVNVNPSAGGQFPVITISWTVNWGQQIGSITGWTGYFAAVAPNLTPTIVGQWLLAKPGGDFEWDHILTGQDRFTQVPTKK